MPMIFSPATPDVLVAYYGILGAGSAAYGDGAALRPLLTDHLDFTGPLAGHRPDATERFLRGISGFIATVQEIELIQDVHAADASAVLYTAHLPGGPMTFSEFFTFDEGRIGTLRLQYNGPEYLEKGGR